MQWLARASPMGPDGLVGFGGAGRGPVAGPPVSARAFGAPFAPNSHSFTHCLASLIGVASSFMGCCKAGAPCIARDRVGLQGLRRRRLSPPILCQLGRRRLGSEADLGLIDATVRRLDVRFGSLADIGQLIRDVRFATESGHVRRRNRCQLCANSRHNPCPRRAAGRSNYRPMQHDRAIVGSRGFQGVPQKALNILGKG